MRESPFTDEALLLSGEPEDFGRFYDRYVRSLLAYFQRRTRDPEVAADLTAETFAAALGARARFEARSVPASVWLFAIAHHKLTDYYRRGSAEDRMRRRLGVERVPVGAEDVSYRVTPVSGGDAAAEAERAAEVLRARINAVGITGARIAVAGDRVGVDAD